MLPMSIVVGAGFEKDPKSTSRVEKNKPKKL
jgi:hypothetical protein